MSGNKEIHVLVVDDVLLMCHFLYETLNAFEGIVCRTSTEFSSAESVLMNSHIDMAIIDIHLKDASGLTLAKRIREGRYQCAHNIPILIFSGNTYKQEVAECLAYDVNDIMAKPFSPATLKERVKKNLQKEHKINSVEYYRELSDEPEVEQEKRKAKAAFVKSTDGQSNYKPKVEQRPSSLDEEAKAFIRWPQGGSSGYHQLDRRLDDVTFMLNALHFNKFRKDKYPDVAKDIKKIRLALDDLEFVADGLREKHEKDPLWSAFYTRLESFNQINIETLSLTNLRTSTIDDIFKKIHRVWMSMLSKPVIKKAD